MSIETDNEAALERLIQLVEAQCAGDFQAAAFDARKFVLDWVDHPHPALAGQKPAEFMCCPEARASVESILGSLWSGAYQ